MVGWLARILLVLGGLIASLFVARDALNFDIFQLVITTLLFTFLVMVITFWPKIMTWFKFTKKK